MDIAKGAAIVLVVTYHSVLFLASTDLELVSIARIRLALELYPMPAFFLIAGILQKRMLTWSLSETWRRRLLPFAYLYIVWTLVRFVFFSALPFVRSDGPWDSGRNPVYLLLAPIAPASVYWYLYAMLMVTLIAWLLRGISPRILLPAAAVLSALFSSDMITTTSFAWDRIGQYLFYFLLGMHASDWIGKFVGRSRLRHVILFGAVLVVTVAAIVFLPPIRRVPGVALVGEVAALATAFTLFSWWGQHKGTRLLQSLGQRVLPIYLLHIYFIALMTIVVDATPAVNALPGRGLLVVCAVSAVAIALSVLCARYLKYVPWLLQPPRLSRARARRQRAATDEGIAPK